jgi:hypothetical protein
MRILSLDKNIAIYITRDQNPNNILNKQGQHGSNQYFDILIKFLSEEKIVNAMLVVKIICNLFNSLNNTKQADIQKLLAYILYERSFVNFKLASLLGNQNKSFQIACSTLYLNYIILIEKLSSKSEQASYLSDVTLEIVEYLNSPELIDNLLNMDFEAIFRVLVAIGTLLVKTYNEKDVELIRTMFKALKAAEDVMQAIVNKSDKYPEKLHKSASAILKILS